MSQATLAADLLKLQASNYHPTTRTRAKGMGLSVFHGPTCTVRGHGNVRTVVGSRCVGCIQAAASIRKDAKEEGREAALRAARAELARDQKAAEKARLKEEAAAVKAQQKADRKTAAAAAKRARNRAKRQASLAPQVAPVEPLAVISCPLEDDDDGLLPWE